MDIDTLSDQVAKFQREALQERDGFGLVTICIAPDGIAQMELVRISPPQLIATIGMLDQIRGQLITALLTGGDSGPEKAH